MLVTTILYAQIKGFAPVLPFVKQYRSLLRQCMTAVNDVTGQEEKLPCTKTKTDKFKLQDGRKNIQLLFSKKRTDFAGFYSFVIDDTVAGAIAEEVVKSAGEKSEANVIEINPGMWMITKQLIQRGIKKFFVCESQRFFWSEELAQKYRENIIIHYYTERIANTNTLDILLPEHLLEIDQPRLIVLINPSRLFIRNILKTIALIDFRFLAKDELHLLMSSEIYSVFQDFSQRFSDLIDYGFIDVIFDIEILAEFPRSVVLPPTFLHVDKMYFIKLKRKKVPLISEKNIIMYWNFINVLSKKKNLPVIACLEKWVPGCGPLLISEGLSISTELRELSKSDFLVLFKTLLSNRDCRFALNIMKKESFMLNEMT